MVSYRFENVFLKSAVLIKLPISYFGFIFLRLSNEFLWTNPSFLFKEASFEDSFVEVCILLLYCFVIVGKTSIQQPSHFSKTGFLRRSLILRLNLSAKTAPYEIFLE